MSRRQKQTDFDRVKQMLRDNRELGVTGREFLLNHCGNRYSARIAELRKEGWLIDSDRMGTDPQSGRQIWRFRLVYEPVGAPVEATTKGAVGAPGASSSPSAEALFDVPAAPRSPYDVTEDAA